MEELTAEATVKPATTNKKTGPTSPELNKSRLDSYNGYWESFLPQIHYSQTRVEPVSEDVLYQNRLLCAKQPEKIQQAYKQLRTQVIQKLMKNHWNSLAVFGLRSQHGATLTAVNLAMSLALDPRVSVLLVDMNLRAPSIHRYFNVTPNVGLKDYDQGLVDIPELLFNPGIDRLVALLNKDRLDQSSEFLASERMSELVSDIRRRYANRVIIFDFPPMLEADDLLACLGYFDAGLLVLNEGSTHKSDCILASQLLGDKPLLGTILNDAD